MERGGQGRGVSGGVHLNQPENSDSEAEVRAPRQQSLDLSTAAFNPTSIQIRSFLAWCLCNLHSSMHHRREPFKHHTDSS